MLFLLFKKMNYVVAFFLIAALSSLPNIVQGKSTPFNNNKYPQNVLIYYFYFTPRCKECYSVERSVKKILNEQYSDQLKSGRIIFKMMNLTHPDPESKRIIQQLKVRRQLLLLLYGDITLNLTKDAFRYVDKQNNKFREMMQNAINQGLSQ
jgi:hypothetical protein